MKLSSWGCSDHQPTKSSPLATYGPSRATFMLSQAVFNSVLADPRAYRIDVRIQGVWRPTTLKQVCSATQ
jgi:hypothetical protein